MRMYHNTPKGPRACKAEKGGCPYAAAGGEHYSTQAEAQAAFEAKMSDAFGLAPKFSKTEQIRQRHYQDIDKLRAFGEKVKDTATKTMAATVGQFSVEARMKRQEARREIIQNKVQAAISYNAQKLEELAAVREVVKDYLAREREAWQRDTAPVRRAASSLAAGLKTARDQGRIILADGNAVRAYANYSLKKRFFSFVAQASRRAADKADFILESKYTRTMPNVEAVKVGDHELPKPRIVVPEKAARLIVVPPKGGGEIFYGGVPEKWLKESNTSLKKEEVYA